VCGRCQLLGGDEERVATSCQTDTDYMRSHAHANTYRYVHSCFTHWSVFSSFGPCRTLQIAGEHLPPPAASWAKCNKLSEAEMHVKICTEAEMHVKIYAKQYNCASVFVCVSV
jgi:hypothetical protein